jgi:hypothetical protein
MCIGQLGSLLPHVTVPAIMAQSLMPLWGLTATEAGVMASALAFGYMLAVPVLTTLTDRVYSVTLRDVSPVSMALRPPLASEKSSARKIEPEARRIRSGSQP